MAWVAACWLPISCQKIHWILRSKLIITLHEWTVVYNNLQYTLHSLPMGQRYVVYVLSSCNIVTCSSVLQRAPTVLVWFVWRDISRPLDCGSKRYWYWHLYKNNENNKKIMMVITIYVAGHALFLAATRQLYEWFSPSVCHYFFYYVHIIVSSCNFQEFRPMTDVTSVQKVKVRSQISRSHG